MKIIELDASNWKTPSDFCDAVYDALGDPRALPLPHQFGCSIDALVDVIVYGGMAYLEPPYSIHVSGLATTPKPVREHVELACTVITNLGRDDGVSMSVNN